MVSRTTILTFVPNRSQTFVHTLIMTFGMDMSFPSGAIILSEAVPKERQGVGMSLVNTVGKYAVNDLL